ncbi:hypothetical protein CH251_23305 [Rhodococcus sp. 06-462-5]|uniref:DUF3710 domain-containing protein n=1 Tax=unclassified Rhodococcus (in: high G+C Gram-positive bacteria) TaxID=192944 RepID=UPI000B9B6264|nr:MULTISPECIES: DUF3710 domain-containing protein [unclassified Rhodococcus (in: high G+C Gram-positive bacteria)]OZC66800.1 hypothetical protein CH251_23305 [Rhodococcus sp. 06-462-5]OZE69013.1 hypothetical protein CH270_04590 [Rhodococcus sp. 02-925g]
MFGRRKKNDAGSASAPGAEPFVDSVEDEDDDIEAADTTAADGPHDLEDLDDDRETVAKTRLDLGSVLIPLPEGGQLQVEMSQAGSPQAVHIVTQFGRITIAAYAAPKSPGQWREVAADLVTSLRNDKAETTVETGPWGRELVGVTANADLRFIGVDGYRWMVRCVLAGPSGAVGEGQPLVRLAHTILRQTVVDRGTDPHPVRTPLPVVLPQVLAEQLAAAAQQQAAAQQSAAQQAAQPQAAVPAEPVAPQQDTPPQPTAAERDRAPRRGASGSAIQQLGG